MYNREEKIIIWLTSFDFMTYKKAKAMLENFDNLEDVFDNLNKYKTDLLKIFSDEEYQELKDNNNLSYIERCIKEYDKLGITVVTAKSSAYSEYLKEIPSYPILLYCKGDISLLKSECLGVVGTRRATKYGSTIGNQMVKDIAMNKITIVSGLAEGIDTVAHKACLEVGGKTIAVLGGGLLNIFPASNIVLAEDIINKGGLIISEYKPNEPAITYHFPIRNRIIAGLSKAIFVVEATEKSGSMHTKNFAIDFNREVFALPARINDIYSVGCNKIIQNGQARMVLSSSEIVDFYGKKLQSSDKLKVLELTFDEQMIYDKLEGQELHFDDLQKETKLATNVLQTLLTRLVMRDIITKLPGNYYTIMKKN